MYESKKQYHYGTGRRKSSIARVRVYENGTGSIIINGREIDDYFGLDTLKLIVRQPLVTTDLLGKVDVVCTCLLYTSALGVQSREGICSPHKPSPNEHAAKFDCSGGQ